MKLTQSIDMETDKDWELVLGEDQSISGAAFGSKDSPTAELIDVAASGSNSYDGLDSSRTMTPGSTTEGYKHPSDVDSLWERLANGTLLGDVQSHRKLAKSRESTKSGGKGIPGSALLEAISAEDEKLAMKLVKSGASPDSGNAWGPALGHPLRGRLEKPTRVLMETGANPDAEDTWGPALTQAIRAGDRELVTGLLQRGANPDAEDTWGPALTQAIRAGYEQLAIELLESGANPDARDTWGPALTQAIRRGHKKLTRVLLQRMPTHMQVTPEGQHLRRR